MNNTPTPRTDEIIEQSWRSINFPNSPIPAKFARQLETELAAVTEQLKETQKHLKDANRGAEINAHALRINADKLIAVTEQRDRLAEECAKIRDVAERAIDYLDQSYRDGFSDEVSELRYELAAVKGGADER